MGCLNLAVWQGCAVGNTGEPGQAWLGGECFMAASVTAQSGTGGVDLVPAWAAWSWGSVTGSAALLVLSHGHVPGPLCHPVLCHLWILRAVDLGGERREGGREGGMDLHAWILLPERGTAGTMLYSSHT